MTFLSIGIHCSLTCFLTLGTENPSFDPPRAYSRLSNESSDLVGADAEGSADTR